MIQVIHNMYECDREFILTKHYCRHKLWKWGKLYHVPLYHIAFFFGARIVQENKGYNFPYGGKIRTQIRRFSDLFFRIFGLYPQIFVGGTMCVMLGVQCVNLGVQCVIWKIAKKCNPRVQRIALKSRDFWWIRLVLISRAGHQACGPARGREKYL